MLKDLNIIATYLVRNDHDILRDSITHNLNNGVDALIVTEHNASKETSEILDDFSDYILCRIVENSPGYDQSIWVTRMARIASALKPEWIIHCDADELWCDLDMTSIDDNVQAVHTDYWYNHFPYSIHEFNVNDAKSFEYASDSSIFGPGMHGLKKIAHRPDEHISIYQGNHGCSLPTASSKIKIKHYPIRTYKQFESKVITGYLACINHHPHLSSHWRRWYKHYIAGELQSIYEQFIRSGLN